MHANSVYHSNRDRENTVESDSRTDRLAYGSSLLEGAEPILPCSSSPRQTCQSRSCPHRFRRAAVPGRNIWVLYSQRVTVQCHSVPCPAQILSWRSAPERSGIGDTVLVWELLSLTTNLGSRMNLRSVDSDSIMPAMFFFTWRERESV